MFTKASLRGEKCGGVGGQPPGIGKHAGSCIKGYMVQRGKVFAEIKRSHVWDNAGS